MHEEMVYKGTKIKWF